MLVPRQDFVQELDASAQRERLDVGVVREDAQRLLVECADPRLWIGGGGSGSSACACSWSDELGFRHCDMVEVEMWFWFVVVGCGDRGDDGGKEVVRGKEESRREALSRGDG
jgi:hypothetical protein